MVEDSVVGLGDEETTDVMVVGGREVEVSGGIVEGDVDPVDESVEVRTVEVVVVGKGMEVEVVGRWVVVIVVVVVGTVVVVMSWKRVCVRERGRFIVYPFTSS